MTIRQANLLHQENGSGVNFLDTDAYADDSWSLGRIKRPASSYISEVNWEPRSDVMMSGMPHLAIQLRTSTFAKAFEFAACPCIIMGNASGQPIHL